MRRTLAEWVRAVVAFVPSRVGSMISASRVGSIISASSVGTVILLGAWVALTALFAFVGNAVLLTVVTTAGHPLGPVLVLLTVLGVFGVPAASLVLARRVVAATVRRVEAAAVRAGDAAPEGRHLATCETTERGRCRTSNCC